MRKGSRPTSAPRLLWPFGVAGVLLVVGAVLLIASDEGWADRTGWTLLGGANVITLVTSVINISKMPEN